MNNKYIKILFLTIFLSLSIFSSSCFAEEYKYAGANNFNVVFVIDGSGSILSSDSAGLRYEAIDLFLGLLPQSGNNVAGIVFDDTIIEKSNMSEINSIPDKKKISNMFRYTNPDGYTDIGLALYEATQLLESRNPNLPSAIILLSDGNTYLSNKNNSTYDNSNNLKSSALQVAQKNGYKVYSVCLNADNKASVQELADISGATNGKCVEIKNALDLKKIFSEFYSLIYSSKTIELVNSVFPDNGIVEKQFSVPSVGVDELNILLECGGKVSNISLMQPSGVLLSGEALSDMTISGNTFSVTKIQNPLSGEWTITVEGTPGQNIKIQLVLNTDISFISQISSDNTSFSIGDNVNITAQITSKGVPVSGIEIYNDYQASLILKKGSDSKEIPMLPSELGYSASIDFSDYGTYYATPKVTINSTELYGSTYVLGVGNTAPTSSTNEINQSLTIWFFKDNTIQLDLSSYALDKEDNTLTFSVSDGNSDNIEYSLDGSILTIKALSPAVSKLTITAEDSLGLSCSFDVILTAESSNSIILKYSLITVAIILAVVILSLIISKSKRFDGQITVQAFNDNEYQYDEQRTAEPIRGKYPLKSVLFNGYGIDVGSSAFYATSKGYIIFKSSKAFYVSGMAGKQKKCTISGNVEFTISPLQDLSQGIRVTFIPNDYLN